MAKLNDDEKKSLAECNDEMEYAKVARRIKNVHGNEYPEDWWAVVMQPGGIADGLKKKWANPAAFDLHVSHPSEEDIKNGRY